MRAVVVRGRTAFARMERHSCARTRASQRLRTSHVSVESRRQWPGERMRERARRLPDTASAAGGQRAPRALPSSLAFSLPADCRPRWPVTRASTPAPAAAPGSARAAPIRPAGAARVSSPGAAHLRFLWWLFHRSARSFQRTQSQSPGPCRRFPFPAPTSSCDPPPSFPLPSRSVSPADSSSTRTAAAGDEASPARGPSGPEERSP